MITPNNGGGSRGTNVKIAPDIGHDRGEIGSTIASGLGAGEAQPQEAACVLLDPNDPLPSAQKFIAANYLREGVRTLHHLSGDFYSWTGTRYRVIDDAAVRAHVYRFAEKARMLVRNPKTGDPLPDEFKPTSAKINNIIDALKAEANLPSTVKNRPHGSTSARVGRPHDREKATGVQFSDLEAINHRQGFEGSGMQHQ